MAEADDVAPWPKPASRRGPLPPIQTKRRMSGSWTENLEPATASKSPDSVKSPEAKASGSRSFFSRSMSEVRPSPDDELLSPVKSSSDSDPSKEGSVKEDKPKSHRRESLKDQLLKFKMKAGKVLEDVHDRLVEDHSSVAVAPISSPNLLSQDVVSVTETLDETSSIDRVISPSLSQSSKRTTTSAELKATMRSKIRKQAEKTVERKRGSVQLAKRLQRRLTIHQEEGPTEGELKSVDEQIEHSLKVGARFLQEQTSLYPPDDVQYAFFVEDYDKEDQPSPPTGVPLLDYRRAEMVSDVDPNLVYYEPRPLDVEANNGQVTLSRMTQRLSDKFFANGKLRRIDESQFVKPLKIIQTEDALYSYVKAEPWEAFVDEIRGSEYVQLDVFLGDLVFDKHPLAGEEDKRHARLVSLYDEQCERINQMTDALMDAENAPTSENSSAFREHANQLYGELRGGAERLAEEYADLENCRNQQGFATSPLKYTVDQEEHESGSLLGKLTMDGPVTPIGALPAPERARIESMKKTSWQVILHFNDIFICKSRSVPIEGFQHKFDQIYNLEIVSEPKSITATIIEKSGTTKKTIAKVSIPLPDNNDNGSSPPTRIPFENAEGTASGFITARSSWSTEARTKRRESAAIATTTNDEPFSIIPPGVRLISDEEFDSNPRWLALEKRSRKRNANGRVPIDGTDIDVPSVMIGEDRRQKATFRTAVDGARASGFANAVKLRMKLLERDQDNAELAYSEIVREEPLPGLFGALGSLFGPADMSRKLKPMRRVPVRQQNFSPASLNLVVNLQAAMDLPTRSDGQLHSIVEAAFQSTTRFTPAVPGRNPNWQHSISLPVNGAEDPKSIIDCIKLNVYDQIVNSLDKDDRMVNTVHEQLVHSLIGWVEIPFSTVYSRGKVDGWLRIQRPVIFTGYTMPDRPTYVKVLIAFDPPMVPPRITAPRRVGSMESEKVLSQCQLWVKSCTAMYESRRYTALVTDINGKAVLACRFLGPVNPPDIVPHPGSNPRQTVEIAARLVSMIPFVTDPVLFPGSTDLWTTNEKFLSLGCGDEEEHATLLCCWLLSYGIPCYLVLGFALPEGARAAYVLVHLLDGAYLANPCDGAVYSTTDAMCPLTSVGTVIAPRNIYANVQSSAHPSQLHLLDFSRSSDWKPLFDKEMDDFQSIQTPSILYAQVSEDALIELRSSIEREIKLRFDEARQFGIPQWNLMASRLVSLPLLREILQEDLRSVDDRLLRLRESYAITVCAVTIPYRNIQDCVAAVLRCGLHTTTSASPQFALAVHLQSVFGHVICCSIAIALLTLKK